MEVEPAALTVHAPIYTPSFKILDINGDYTLRDNFHKNMKIIFDKIGFKPKRILDLGCSTGLSTVKFSESFSDVEIIGLDLSPHMLAGKNHYYSSVHYSNLSLNSFPAHYSSSYFLIIVCMYNNSSRLVYHISSHYSYPTHYSFTSLRQFFFLYSFLSLYFFTSFHHYSRYVQSED